MREPQPQATAVELPIVPVVPLSWGDYSTLVRRQQWQELWWAIQKAAWTEPRGDDHLTTQAPVVEVPSGSLTTAEIEAFRLGAMESAPCFKCGYNGEGYFQPSKHHCAEYHHLLNGEGRDSDNALLSRTGGRSSVVPSTIKIAEVLQEKIMIDEKEAMEVAEEIVMRI